MLQVALAGDMGQVGQRMSKLLPGAPRLTTPVFIIEVKDALAAPVRLSGEPGPPLKWQVVQTWLGAPVFAFQMPTMLSPL